MSTCRPTPPLVFLVSLLLLVGAASALPQPRYQGQVPLIDYHTPNDLTLNDPQRYDLALTYPTEEGDDDTLAIDDPLLAYFLDQGLVELVVTPSGLVEVRVKSSEIENSNEGEEDEGQDGGSQERNEEHPRQKRQTTVSGNANVETVRGGRRMFGNLNLAHTWLRSHKLSGNLGVDYTRTTGYPSQRNFNAGVNYRWSPNPRTSLTFGTTRRWGSGGRGTTYGLDFSRTFGKR